MATSVISAIETGYTVWCAGEPSSDRASFQGNRAGQGSVLVVDDETLIADGVAKILNRFGFQAVPSYSAADAMVRLETSCPDVLLTDVVMPLMNGIELAVAARRRCPRTRILLFSGQAVTGDLLDRARAEGHDFELLPKPIHPEQLLKILRS